MDGIETARRIRRMVGPDTMIIMITAYSWIEIEQEAREAGIDYFLAKPLLRSSIFDTLSQLGKKDMAPKEASDSPLEGRRILLVEDNELNQEIAKTLLELHGAAVDVASNGKEAVDAYQSQPPGTYQAILMDIRMPVMDGLEATKAIRTMNRSDSSTLPILAMTANAFEEDKKEAYAACMSGYLIKPLDITTLLRELNRVL